MTTINGTAMQILLLALIVSAGLTFYQASADAQDASGSASTEDQKPDGGENESDGGADEGEDEGEGEGEGEDGAQSPWTLSGIVNRSFLTWNDGRRGARLVDNDQDSTGFALEGEFELGRGWTAGLTFGLDTFYASSDTVDQLDPNGDGGVIELSDAFFEIGHQKWGKIALGFSDSASDDIDNINLSGSDVIADASVNSWNNNFFLRGIGIGLAAGRTPLPTASGGGGDDDEDEVEGNPGLAELRWGDFLDGPLAGETGRFITYVTPEVMGFEGAVSVGRPQEIFPLRGSNFEFNDTRGGLFRDAALRYTGTWNNMFRVNAGIGFWKDDAEEQDAEEPTQDRGWAGSLALLHIPTGLNLALNYGTESHTNRCVEPGEVSGRCRGDDRFIYAKGGLVRDLFNWGPSWGPTSFYGEYYKGWKAQNETDEDVLRFAELSFGEAEELRSSVATMWGLGVSQTFKSTGSFPLLAEVYVGYRHYELDLRLIGSDGPVASRGIKDFDVIMAGVTVRWGGQPEDALGRPLERPQRRTAANGGNSRSSRGE
jgi:hypothetical protein